MKRVVVTGLGMINALGLDKETAFAGIIEGKCGIKTIDLFDTEGQSVTIAGEITDFEASMVLDAKEAKKADRFIQLGLKAAAEALAIPNLSLSKSSGNFASSIASAAALSPN